MSEINAWQKYKKRVENLKNNEKLSSPDNLHDKIKYKTNILGDNMNKQILAPGISIYKDVFDNPKQIIEDIENMFSSRYALGGVYEGNNKESYLVNTNSRNVDTFSLTDSMASNMSEEESSLYNRIKEPMLQCLFDYKSEHGIAELIDDSWMVLRYGR
ncbi:MAG: hypothetical protein ACO3UU_14715 [Minisyncoccia bacterium]